MFKLIHAILTAYDYRPKYQPYFPLLTSKIINQIESNAKEYLITLIKRFFIDVAKQFFNFGISHLVAFYSV